jgi:prepilin-type N-terminal cleavage/methylation domain-containing protein
MRVKKRGLKWGERAFTLAEVMVAVFVLGTISIAFYGGLSSGFAVTQAAREDLRATQILMQKTEGIRLCTWSELSNYTFRESYDPVGTNQSKGVVYTGIVSIGSATNIPAAAAYKGNMKTVTVSIFWTNYNGSLPVVQRREMQTLVARYGLQNYIWGAMQ